MALGKYDKENVEKIDTNLFANLPLELIVTILLCLPKNRHQLSSIAFTSHSFFKLAKTKEVLNLFPYQFDFTKPSCKEIYETGIEASALSPDGRTIALYQIGSLGFNSIITKLQLMDIQTGKITQILNKVNHSYYNLYFRRHINHLLAIGMEYIDVYDLASGNLLKSLPSPGAWGRVACLSDSQFLAGSIDSELKLYDMAQKICTPLRDKEEKKIYPAAILSAKNKQFIIIQHDSHSNANETILKYYDIEKSVFLDDISIPCSPINNLYLSEDDKHIYFKDSNNVQDLIKLFNIETGQIKHLEMDVNMRKFEFKICELSRSIFLCQLNPDGLMSGCIKLVNLDKGGKPIVMTNVLHHKMYTNHTGEIMITFRNQNVHFYGERTVITIHKYPKLLTSELIDDETNQQNLLCTLGGN